MIYLIIKDFNNWDDAARNVRAAYSDKAKAKKALEYYEEQNKIDIEKGVKHADCISYWIDEVELDPEEPVER